MKKLIPLLLFVPLISFGQMDYFVSAKGGLNVREAPNAKAKKVATLLYGQKVTIESKTESAPNGWYEQIIWEVLVRVNRHGEKIE